MSPFELAEPASLAEAIALLGMENARPLSGGTALMLMMKAGVLRPARLVSLRKLKLDEIRADGELRIGAMASLRALERSAKVKAGWPAITRTLRTLSNVRVRNVATVGGALAHADPHMDLPPLLIALGASIRLVGPLGERTMPVEELFTGYFETVLQRNELISELHVPAQGQRNAAYLKVTTGSAEDWPALGVAVVLDAVGSEAKSGLIVVSAA